MDVSVEAIEDKLSNRIEEVKISKRNHGLLKGLKESLKIVEDVRNKEEAIYEEWAIKRGY